MAAIAQGMVSNILNATLPTGASAGQPSAWTSISASAMKLRLNSTSSTAATAGTQLASGSGYTTGGTAFGTSSTASSNGSSVTLPAGSAMSWTNSGTGWTIQSLDITDNAGTTRAWFGDFNGAPITVAAGNTFQIAVGAVTVSLT